MNARRITLIFLAAAAVSLPAAALPSSCWQKVIRDGNISPG